MNKAYFPTTTMTLAEMRELYRKDAATNFGWDGIDFTVKVEWVVRKGAYAYRWVTVTHADGSIEERSQEWVA